MKSTDIERSNIDYNHASAANRHGSIQDSIRISQTQLWLFTRISVRDVLPMHESTVSQPAMTLAKSRVLSFSALQCTQEENALLCSCYYAVALMLGEKSLGSGGAPYQFAGSSLDLADCLRSL